MREQSRISLVNSLIDATPLFFESQKIYVQKGISDIISRISGRGNMFDLKDLYSSFSAFLKEKCERGSQENLTASVPSKLLIMFPQIVAAWYIEANIHAGVLRVSSYGGPKKFRIAEEGSVLLHFSPGYEDKSLKKKLLDLYRKLSPKEFLLALEAFPVRGEMGALTGFIVAGTEEDSFTREFLFREIGCISEYLSMTVEIIQLRSHLGEIDRNYEIVRKGLAAGKFSPAEEMKKVLSHLQEKAFDLFQGEFSVLFRREGDLLVSQAYFPRENLPLLEHISWGELRIPVHMDKRAKESWYFAAPFYREKIELHGIPDGFNKKLGKVIAVPICPFGKDIYVIALYYSSLRNEEEERLGIMARSFSELASSSVESTLNRISLTSATKDLLDEKGKIQKLLTLTNLVTASLDTEHTSRIAIDVIREFFDASTCGFFTLSQERKEGILVCSFLQEEKDDSFRRLILPLEEYPHFACAEEGIHPEFINSTGEFSFTREERALLHSLNIGRLMIIPVRYQGNLIGTILIGHELEGKIFSDRDLKFAGVIGNQIASSMSNSRLYATVLQDKNEWELIFNSISDGIIILDRDLRIIKSNKLFGDTYGLDPTKTIGKTCHEIFTCSHHGTDVCIHRRCITEKKAVKGIYDDLPVPGTYRVTISPIFDSNGEVVRTVHFLTDITKELDYEKKIESSLKQAEEASRYLETLLESSPDSIISTDMEGHIVYFSRGASDLLGYKNEEVIGKDISFIYPSPEESQRVRESLERGKGKIRNFHTRLKKEDGNCVDIILSASSLYDEKGQEVGTVRISKDISKTKQIEDHLRQTEKLSALGKLSSGIAHDFNNILAAISMRAELMKLRTEDPDLTKDLEVIENSAMQGAETVNKLRTFYKRERTEYESANLNDVIEQAIEITSPRWKDVSHSRGILTEVKLHFADNLRNIEGSTGDLKDSIINLIFNALDAMPHGGTIDVTTENLLDAVRVTITDTGIGMSQEVMKRVFEPFYSTKGEKGSGLGLSTVYGIVQSHGGTIDIDSEEGKGTTFTIAFPVSHRKSVHSRKPEESLFFDIKGTSIILFEDDRDIRESAAQILEQKGCLVSAFEGGTEGVRFLKNTLPDFGKDDRVIVITDLGMPEVNGFEIAKITKSLNRNVPVIMITGWGRLIGPGKGLLHGVDRFIPKPLRMKDLIGTIGELTNHPHE